MCCLNYEQETYENIRTKLPKIGAVVDTSCGRGEVVDNSVIKESVKVKMQCEGEDEAIKEIPISEITLVSGSYEGTVNEEDVKIDVESLAEDPESIKQLLSDDN